MSHIRTHSSFPSIVLINKPKKEKGQIQIKRAPSSATFACIRIQIPNPSNQVRTPTSPAQIPKSSPNQNSTIGFSRHFRKSFASRIIIPLHAVFTLHFYTPTPPKKTKNELLLFLFKWLILDALVSVYKPSQIRSSPFSLLFSFFPISLFLSF